MKIDRATALITNSKTPIYTATKDGEIVFSLLATSERVCNLYLTRTTGGTPIEYAVRLTPLTPWKLPGKIVLRVNEGFTAIVREVNPIDWHSLPDWDTNADWDSPGENSGAIASIDLSVIQL